MPKLKAAPNNAQIKNILEGLYLSLIVNSANKNVPIIKPNCTAELMSPRACTLKLKFKIRSSIIEFPANQREVQQNCENIIIGKTHLEIDTVVVLFKFSVYFCLACW